jgi:hypothetical protein
MNKKGVKKSEVVARLTKLVAKNEWWCGLGGFAPVKKKKWLSNQW